MLMSENLVVKPMFDYFMVIFWAPSRTRGK